MDGRKTRFDLRLDHDPDEYLRLNAQLDEPSLEAVVQDHEVLIRERARHVAAHELAPRATRIDAENDFPTEGMRSLADAGLTGLLFPRELGGLAESNVSYAITVEEIAAACASTSLVFMTQMHCAYPIHLMGGDHLQHTYIPGLLDGSLYGALAITEPDAGSDAASLSTSARRTGDGWLLSGHKTFITTGDRADVLIVFATVDRNAGREAITAFVVEGNWQGVSHGRPFEKLGMHGSSTTDVYFDDVHVPDGNVLGNVGEGWSTLMRSVVKSRISAAAQGVGLARAAYVRTLTALWSIHDGDIPAEPLFELAELRGQVLGGRLLLYSVARQIDTDSETSPGDVAVMKQSCTDLGWRSAVTAARILGPWGDLRSLGVERCARDAKVTQIYDGTNEIQRLLIGREISRAMSTGEAHMTPTTASSEEKR